MSSMLLGKSRGHLPLGPKRMKQLGQSGNDAQLRMCLVVEVQCYNVSSKNQGKLDVVQQEVAGVNINILGINELKWTEMGGLNSDEY